MAEEKYEKTSEETTEDTGEGRYSFTHEVKVPDISEGLWRSHDAFTAVVRRIMKCEPDNMSELLAKACEEQCAHNKKLLSEIGNLEDLGYGPENDDEDNDKADDEY